MTPGETSTPPRPTTRASWRIFTITVVLVAAFAGYVLGVLTAESVGQTTAWHQGYNAALTHQGAHHDRP